MVRYGPVARDKYKDIMKFKERRHVTCRETGIVINPSVFWLGARPDGLLYDCESTKPDGLLEIKCPEGKKNSTPSEIMNDPSFYVELSEGKPALKKEHPLTCYSQIQFQRGLSQLPWCDFVVYTFKGVIIIRVPYGSAYFSKLLNKVNDFYFNHYLDQIIKDDNSMNSVFQVPK